MHVCTLNESDKLLANYYTEIPFTKYKKQKSVALTVYC